MSLAKISSKGQLTLPKEVRDGLAVGAGDRVEFLEVSKNRYEIIAVTRDVTTLKGLFGKTDKVVTIEEMNAGIEKMGSQ